MSINEALSGPLAAMVKYRQFIVYKLVPSQSRPGKTDKFPCDFRDGRVVSAHDPAYWTDAWTALAAATNFGASFGLAFVFTEADDLWFIDVDNCLQADNTWSPIAITLCEMFRGCAIEISQSLRGLHIFGSGRAPAHGTKNIPMGLEFYTKLRFVALTGIGAVGDAALDCSAILPALVAQYFPPDAGGGLAQEWTTEARSEWRGPASDEELIKRALRSQSTASAFGGRASFADLWTANIDALSRCYPDPVRAYDASSADAALAQHLAFWTGANCERIDRLMRQSALARDKWDRHSDPYLERTILGAVGVNLKC